MDFCADSRCYSEAVTRSDLENAHLPTHDLVKIRTNIQWHDLDGLKNSALEVLKQWRLPPAPTSNIQAADDNEKPSTEDEETQPERPTHCFACRTIVTQPYWYCTLCTGEILADVTVT